MAEFLHVVTTTDDRELADRIAEALVARRLAACVQVQGPIRSTYRWQGKIERADEWLVVAKTSRERFAAVAAAIGELHRYEVPEIIALPIVDGAPSYLDWLRTELSGMAPSE